MSACSMRIATVLIAFSSAACPFASRSQTPSSRHASQPAGSAEAPQSAIEPITSALRDGQFAAAANLARSALQQFPHDARLWSLQGIALASSGNTPDALVAFRKALQIAPND